MMIHVHLSAMKCLHSSSEFWKLLKVKCKLQLVALLQVFKSLQGFVSAQKELPVIWAKGGWWSSWRPAARTLHMLHGFYGSLTFGEGLPLLICVQLWLSMCAHPQQHSLLKSRWCIITDVNYIAHYPSSPPWMCCISLFPLWLFFFFFLPQKSRINKRAAIFFCLPMSPLFQHQCSAAHSPEPSGATISHWNTNTIEISERKQANAVRPQRPSRDHPAAA